MIQGKSPRLLLLISYVAIGVNLLDHDLGGIRAASILSGLLGFVLPGVIVFLLLSRSPSSTSPRGASVLTPCSTQNGPRCRGRRGPFCVRSGQLRAAVPV